MANGMGSLFVGSSGVRSSQDALNTVANNLANLSTAGYVRQQVVFRDVEYNNISYAKNGYKKLTGLGTSIGELVHARDIFLDKAFRQENGRRSYYEASFEAVDEVQTLFNELEGTAFQQIINGPGLDTEEGESLWHAFQEWSKNPSDTVNQNLVIQKASLFVSRAYAVYKGITNYQSNINGQISQNIDTINDYAKRIYELNNRVAAIEAGGRETAMNERDERDYLVDQLSSYGSISYSEDINGVMEVQFEGETLVNEMNYYEIGKKTDRMTGYITPYWPHLSNEEAGRYVEVLDFTRKICTEYNTDVGSLKALVQARGTGITNYNDINNIDPDLYDATTGLSVMENTLAEFDQLVHGIAKQINDLFVPNKVQDTITVDNGDGTYTRYHNVKVLDTEHCYVGADGKLPPQELFTRTGCSRYKEVRDKDSGETFYIYNEEDYNDSVGMTINGKTYKIYDMENGTTVRHFTIDKDGKEQYLGNEQPYMPWNKEDNEKYTRQVISGQTLWVLNDNYTYDTSVQYTVAELHINENLKKQVTSLPYINPEHEIAYDLGAKISELWEEKTLTINPRFSTAYNFSDYYQEMIGEVAIIGEMYNSTAESLDGAVREIDNGRDGVIGVSSEEELTKMIKYQNAYNASSRYIQTVSDMIEALVTGLGA